MLFLIKNAEMFSGEGDVVANCFPKESEGDRAFQIEPSFQWLDTLFVLVPITTESPHRRSSPTHPGIVTNNWVHFSSAALWRRRKKIPELFTQSQEAMLRYVCSDKTSDGRQIRQHTHTLTRTGNTHSACVRWWWWCVRACMCVCVC